MKTKLLSMVVAATVMSSSTFAESPVFYPKWQHTDVHSAWNSGYRGQGTVITFADDFRTSTNMTARLTSVFTTQTHGDWTSQEAKLIAPDASIQKTQFVGAPINLVPNKFNIINASYRYSYWKGYKVHQIHMGATEQSIINAAHTATAVITKAAGNDRVPVNGVTANGMQDYLNLALIGTRTTMYVGALDRNGSPTNKANIAWYSNTAGTHATIQRYYLMVGVDSGAIGLYGTSFAAPVVAGYSAILSSKFKTASPIAITNRLLNTARTDTINGYNRAIHGRGEASLSRAIAPASIR